MKQDRTGRMLITQNVKTSVPAPLIAPGGVRIIKKRPKKVRKKTRYRDNRKLKRAQLMRVERTETPGMFHVYPYPEIEPEKLHEVIEGREGINAAGNMCDCRNGNSPCAHVVAIRLMIEQEEKRERINQRRTRN